MGRATDSGVGLGAEHSVVAEHFAITPYTAVGCVGAWNVVEVDCAGQGGERGGCELVVVHCGTSHLSICASKLRALEQSSTKM